jgi:hypothetical protein
MWRESAARLAGTSKMLNEAFDTLTAEVGVFDADLGKLPLVVLLRERESNPASGVLTIEKARLAWTPIGDGQVEDYAACQIGYAKVGKNWGLAIRAGNSREKPCIVHMWRFADAPHVLRSEAVEFIPCLVDQMIEENSSLMASLGREAAAAEDTLRSLREKYNLKSDSTVPSIPFLTPRELRMTKIRGYLRNTRLSPSSFRLSLYFVEDSALPQGNCEAIVLDFDGVRWSGTLNSTNSSNKPYVHDWLTRDDGTSRKCTDVFTEQGLAAFAELDFELTDGNTFRLLRVVDKGR